MKIATFKRAGQGSSAVQWLGLLAIIMLLLGTVNSMATAVTTLGGGPQYYNAGSSYGSSNNVYGTLYSQFHTPSGIAYDSSYDYLYVADRDNNAIRQISSPSGSSSQATTFAPYPPHPDQFDFPAGWGGS